ncbi:isochorismatase [Streptomyces armeniacus]|uniref:Isochorismatase n=1 Tax=Streptomyces armeniacus TaxID=83291 RepID=A0A345XYR3_9ACTN|nr:isochorismatase [Streptomyces armeniacus]AXK36779.1 isochorismatase [Streptomyces armeniacus]
MRSLAGASYRTRPIRFLELWEHGGWRVKVYGIAAAAELPRPALVTAAKATAAQHLPREPGGDGRHGAAFLTVHDGADGTWVLVDWWANGNLLHHLPFGGDLADPAGELRPLTGGLAACTYELAVTDFERRAWLREVYAAERPDLDGYLAARLEAEV